MYTKCLNILVLSISLLLAINAQAATKIIFSIDLIRHGDRTPIHEFANAPYPWKQGLGELTAEGMQQEFQLGSRLHKQYIEQQHLLPAHYLAETMYVRSSDFNRTLMSAESLLYGLYPLGSGPNVSLDDKPGLPGAFQPIPIHTVPQNQDTLFVTDSDKDKFNALLQQHVFITPEWQAKTNELQNQFKHWSEITGLPINNLYNVVTPANILYIRQLHHVPFPKGVTSDDAKQIIATGIWAFAHTYAVKEVAYPVGHQMLSAVNEYFQQASQHKTKLKYVLLSGHDSSIMSVLTLLGHPLDQWPHYASDLNFSLYENNGEYLIKVTFNGQPVVISTCGGDTCSLAQFSNYGDSSLNK